MSRYEGGATSAHLWHILHGSGGIALPSNSLILNAPMSSNAYTGGGRSFNNPTSPGSNFLYRASETANQLNSGDWSILCFVNPTNYNAYRVIVSKFAAGDYEYTVACKITTGELGVGIGPGPGPDFLKLHWHPTAVPLGKWSMVCASHVLSTKTIGCGFRYDAEDTAVYTGTAGNSTTQMQIGGYYSSGGTAAGDPFHGGMASLLITKRIVTTAEKTWFYNKGNGRTASEVASHATLNDAYLVDFWPLNEISGNGIGSINGRTLTQVGTVTAGNGPAEAIASDETSNANHGQLIGFSAAQQITAWTPNTPDGSYTATVTDGQGSNHGTMTGFSDVDAARTADVSPNCPVSQSIKFDGTDDRITFSNPLFGASATQFTASFWSDVSQADIDTTLDMVYDDCAGNPNALNGFYVGFDDRGGSSINAVAISLRSLTANGSVAWANQVPSTKTWQHYCIVYNSTSGLKCYVNGADAGAGSGHLGSGDFVPRNATAYLGGMNDSSSFSLSSKIADFRLYASALTSDNVLYLATNGSSGTAPGVNPVSKLIGYDTARSVPDCADGYGLILDGTDDYVLGSATGRTPKTIFTYVAWVKVLSLAEYGVPFMEGTSLETYPFQTLYIEQTTGKLYYQYIPDSGGGSQSSTTSTTGITIGQWTHIACVNNGNGTGTFYFNGTANGNFTITDPTANTFANLTHMSLGAQVRTNAVYPLNGVIDDPRIYNIALTASQVAALAAGNPLAANYPPAANLVGHWKFDDGAQANPMTGDPILGHRSIVGDWYFSQDAIANRPLYDDDGMNNRPTFDFNGSSKWLYSTQVNKATQQGCLSLACRPTTGAAMCLFALSDTGSDTDYVYCGITAAGKAIIEHKSGGTTNSVTGGTTLTDGARCIVQFYSDGSTWGITINGVAETLTPSGSNTGAWFGDVASPDKWALGALVGNTVSNHLNGEIGQYVMYDDETTPSKRKSMYRALKKLYGIGA